MTVEQSNNRYNAKRYNALIARATLQTAMTRKRAQSVYIGVQYSQYTLLHTWICQLPIAAWRENLQINHLLNSAKDCAPLRRLALIPGVHHFAGYGGRRREGRGQRLAVGW